MNMVSQINGDDTLPIDIAVIGGGASGMAAAIYAQKTCREANYKSCRIVVFERNDRVGKKLLMTGNGRCNLTNLDDDLSRFHGKDVRFAKGALMRYPPSKVISIFEELGLFCIVEEAQKVYPMSLHAASVLDSLRLSLEEYGIKIISGVQIIDLAKDMDEFIFSSSDNRVFRAKSVIVAAGGMCAPSTGSDGNGYNLFAKFSHRLLSPLPSIVQVKTDASFCKPLSGNKILGAAALYCNGKKIRAESGEILFTDYGLSGPPILQLSGYISRILSAHAHQKHTDDVSICLDFLPGYSLDQVRAMLNIRKYAFPNRKIDEFLTGIFHKRLSLGLLREITDRSLHASASTISEEEIEKLSLACKALSIKVTGTMSFVYAQTTAGGMDTSDFDPSTMSSKKTSGLFACGEILDIDGDCGGFNLQWAWSSGFLAGTSASKFISLKRETYET